LAKKLVANWVTADQRPRLLLLILIGCYIGSNTFSDQFSSKSVAKSVAKREFSSSEDRRERLLHLLGIEERKA
jgi:hypothetical protein